MAIVNDKAIAKTIAMAIDIWADATTFVIVYLYQEKQDPAEVEKNATLKCLIERIFFLVTFSFYLLPNTLYPLPFCLKHLAFSLCHLAFSILPLAINL